MSDEILSHISPGPSDNINFSGVITVDVEAEPAKRDTSGPRNCASWGSEPFGAGPLAADRDGGPAVDFAGEWQQRLLVSLDST